MCNQVVASILIINKRITYFQQHLYQLIKFSLLLGFIILSGCTTTPEVNKKEKPIPVFPPPPEKARFKYERSLYSSLDVSSEDSVNRFRRLVTGEQRMGQGLAKPFDVKVYQGRVYVSDTVLRSVMVFDIKGKRFFQIGRKAPGLLYLPLGLSIDAQGTLYVCDATAKRIIVYDKDGNYLRAIGGKAYFTRPSGVTVDSSGSRLYVVDTAGVGSKNHRVQVFNAKTGEFIKSIGKRGSADGELNLPRDAVITSNGDLYVVDGGNFRIQVFGEQGNFKFGFGAVGRRPGQFSRPKGISADKQGNIYIVDAAFGNIQVFSPEGKLLMVIGKRGNQDAPARYMLPAGIDIDENGRVYVIDQFFRKVDIYKPVSKLVEKGSNPEHSDKVKK